MRIVPSIFVALIFFLMLQRPVVAEERLRGVQAYKDNYFLYTRDSESHADHPLQSDRMSSEVRFQFSLKIPVLYTPLFYMYFGYSQKSFWQVFDLPNSRPFRENNYNPELFLTLFHNTPYPVQVGIWEHESNGQVEPYSRSWDRSYLWPRYYFSEQGWVGLKLWRRYSEEPKKTPDDTEGDENPEILSYLGWFQLGWHWPLDGWQIAGFARKGSADKYGTLQADVKVQAQRFLSWAEPWIALSPKTYFHISTFSGYGESLIDYNERVRKVGAGFSAEF